MKKLRVLVRFRDEQNFFTIHEEGDIIVVSDSDRVTRLIEGGVCENADKKAPSAEVVKEEVLERAEPEQPVAEKPVEEKPKRATRKKKEA